MSKLSGALWQQGGKRKERLQLRLWNLNFASNFPVAPCQLSCQISANRHEAETSANEQTLKSTWKHVPRVMRSLLMSSPPISTSHRLFRCRYLNSRDVVAIYPFSSHPGELARRLPKIQRFDMSLTVKRFLTTFLKGSSYMYNYTWFSWKGCFCHS